MLLSGTRTLDHIESSFDNIAEVDTNGIDGGISYTLDTKRRGLGDFGTFVLGVQGTYINSYLIKSPRALREYYRDATQGAALPVFNMDGTRDYYERVCAEYEAAGYRNVENFAPADAEAAFLGAVALAVLRTRDRRDDALRRRLQRRQRDDGRALRGHASERCVRHQQPRPRRGRDDPRVGRVRRQLRVHLRQRRRAAPAARRRCAQPARRALRPRSSRPSATRSASTIRAAG